MDVFQVIPTVTNHFNKQSKFETMQTLPITEKIHIVKADKASNLRQQIIELN